jgi:methylenetetrahydrofolate dehydrogenase (NADP+)/methenyltetrahydrofolate cyclohydrolase
MQLIDGKRISREIQDEIRAEVQRMQAAGLRPPHLAAVIVGENPASQTYVRHKLEACAYAGFRSTRIQLDAQVSEADLLAEIRRLNEDPELDGFIVQLPLPPQIDPQRVTEAILPAKDVDGFHPVNIGMMTLNFPSILPATPLGIMELLRRSGIETRGRHCVVIGRSRIVGRPVSIMLSQGGEATVTLCHTRTPRELLLQQCRQADILVVAAGQPGLLTAEMVKPGAVVIDVGTNRVEAPGTKSGYRMAGDVAFDEVAPLCSYITPVPGGVGPMTVAMLLRNTLEACQRRHAAGQS